MSVASASLGIGWASLLETAGESLTLRNLPVTGLVARIRGEKDAMRFDRSKISYGTRGASVIELSLLEFATATSFAGSFPKAGEAFTDSDSVTHIVADVVRMGATLLCYCKMV